MTQNTVEIARAPRVFNDDALANITDFDSAMSALIDSGSVVEQITDYGNGFSVVEDKRRLCGVPFLILEWKFNDSDMSDLPFASATIVTQSGEKLILNDGGSGIRDQLMRVAAKRGPGAALTGLLVPKGLAESNYMYTDESGKERPATTFYLSESV